MSNKHPVDCVSEATHVVTVEDRRPFVVNHQCLCTNFMAPEKSCVLEHVAHRRSRTFESRDAGSMLKWWMHHLEKCTDVFIKNAHLNMVQMRLPPPPFFNVDPDM